MWFLWVLVWPLTLVAAVCTLVERRRQVRAAVKARRN